jgi:hypothetical protein
VLRPRLHSVLGTHHWVLALALAALWPATASAQTPSPTQGACTVTSYSSFSPLAPAAHYGFAGYPGGPTSGVVAPSYSLNVYGSCAPATVATPVDPYARLGATNPFYTFGYSYPFNAYALIGALDGTTANVSTATTGPVPTGSAAPTFVPQATGSGTSSASGTGTISGTSTTTNPFNVPGASAVYYPSVTPSAPAVSNAPAPAVAAPPTMTLQQPTAGTAYGGFAGYPGAMASGAVSTTAGTGGYTSFVPATSGAMQTQTGAGGVPTAAGGYSSFVPSTVGTAPAPTGHGVTPGYGPATPAPQPYGGIFAPTGYGASGTYTWPSPVPGSACGNAVC